jgi:hypothetical protein
MGHKIQCCFGENKSADLNPNPNPVSPSGQDTGAVAIAVWLSIVFRAVLNSIIANKLLA